jgi:hypothetical protein
MSYLNGTKVCYDFCDSTTLCMRMFEDLIEHIGSVLDRIHGGRAQEEHTASLWSLDGDRSLLSPPCLLRKAPSEQAAPRATGGDHRCGTEDTDAGDRELAIAHAVVAHGEGVRDFGPAIGDFDDATH